MNNSTNNELRLYLIIAALVLAIGAIFGACAWDKIRPVVPATPAPIVSVLPPTGPVKINQPNEIQKEEVAKGDIKKDSGRLVVKDNEKPVRVIVPPTRVEGGGSNVSIKPATPQATSSEEYTIPAGGGTVELPEQKWTLTIEREYSPFRANIHLYPEPSLGLGYDLITLDLNKPFGLNLQLGTLSAGPFISMSMLGNGNYYVGGELAKSLGRVNANIGYGWNTRTGGGNIVAGLSFNFR